MLRINSLLAQISKDSKIYFCSTQLLSEAYNYKVSNRKQWLICDRVSKVKAKKVKLSP
jgi:hypothetical protein